MSHEDDDLVEAAQQQFRQLGTARLRAQAQLAEYRSDGNRDGIQEQLQELANIDAASSNLTNLARRHAQSQQAPLPQTDGEFMAKRPERMDYNDVLQMTAKSKYGAVTPEELQRGINELHRLKGLGQYKD